jgi:hypothetical protein
VGTASDESTKVNTGVLEETSHHISLVLHPNSLIQLRERAAAYIDAQRTHISKLSKKLLLKKTLLKKQEYQIHT